MKDAEDEAFDELAKRQGHWGGGFMAKKAMAADKLQEPPSEWAGIKAILDEYGLQAIDFVADFKAALAQPAQEPVREALKLADIAKIPTLTHGLLVKLADVEAVINEALAQPAQEPDALTIAYQSGYHDGKKAALAGREWNFCPRCGKRTNDIHTCTPPQEAS